MKDRDFVITFEWLEANRTKRGGYTKAQVKAVGLSYPLISGWREDLIGKKISTKQAERFESGAKVYSKAKTMKLQKIFNSLNSLSSSELIQIKEKVDSLL